MRHQTPSESSLIGSDSQNRSSSGCLCRAVRFPREENTRWHTNLRSIALHCVADTRCGGSVHVPGYIKDHRRAVGILPNSGYSGPVRDRHCSNGLARRRGVRSGYTDQRQVTTVSRCHIGLRGACGHPRPGLRCSQAIHRRTGYRTIRNAARGPDFPRLPQAQRHASRRARHRARSCPYV